jgi:hypothetical protein
MASIKDLCLYIKGTGLLNLRWTSTKGCTISLRLRCIRDISWWARRMKMKMNINKLLLLHQVGISYYLFLIFVRSAELGSSKFINQET